MSGRSARARSCPSSSFSTTLEPLRSMSETMTTASPPDAPGQEGRPTPPSRPGRGKRLAVAGLIVAALIALAVAFDGQPVPGAEHYGWLSLLPPLTTLILVFVTREVISSLFLGIVMGGLVIG